MEARPLDKGVMGNSNLEKTELIVFGKQDTHTFLNGTLELFLQFQFASENNARYFL